MHDAAHRAMIFDAAKGLDALNMFIETRFARADEYEAAGDHECAELMRGIWTDVWAALGDVPQRALAAELHEIMSPRVHDEGHAFV